MDDLNIKAVAQEFANKNEERINYFGSFTERKNKNDFVALEHNIIVKSEFFTMSFHLVRK